MTYGINPQQQPPYGPGPPVLQKKPMYKRWWFWPAVVMLALCAFPTFGTSSKDPAPVDDPPVETVVEVDLEDLDAEPEPEPEETTAPEPEPEPTVEEPEFEITQQDGTTRVHFEIEDAFFNSGITRNAQKQTLQGLQAAVEEFPEYESIHISGEFLTTDTYGNQGMSDLFNLRYTKETVDKINFDNIDSANVFKIYDAGTIHPDLIN